MLECFQGEVAKRILQLPKWYSNTAAIVALGWSSLHATCRIRKLRFLHRVMKNEASIWLRNFTAMVDDVVALNLVRECRELEERYKLSSTSQVLNVNDSADSLIVVREAKEYIIKEHWTLLLNKVLNYPFLYHIAVSVGWNKLWDHALDHGSSVIKSM